MLQQPSPDACVQVSGQQSFAPAPSSTAKFLL